MTNNQWLFADLDTIIDCSKSINNPCEYCKRKECPKVCYPKKDYEKAVRKCK